MALIEIRDYSFSFAGYNNEVLKNISLDVESGEFILLCGKSGSGKSTLLRSFKKEIAPVGKSSGIIRIDEKEKLSPRESASMVGFVMQNPENQIVMDSVWLELAFGLENLGVPSEQIGRRIGEIAAFFGIESWFEKKVFELSGGQKQILTLASILAMQAEIIVLDEPTSQLDPIAAKEFLQMLKKVNSELGKTVIISEHLIGEVLSSSDKVLYLEEGRVEYFGSNRDFPSFLIENEAEKSFTCVLPEPTCLAIRENEEGFFPLDVREGRKWLHDISTKKKAFRKVPVVTNELDWTEEDEKRKDADIVMQLKDVWFRYNKNSDFVHKGIETKIVNGEIHAYVGGNGSGKSTLLKLLSKINKPQKGKVIIREDKKVCLLVQDPKSVFVCDDLLSDLMENNSEISKEEAIKMAEKMGLGNLLERHPYDLSGGEMQKAAIAKVLLRKPDILLLDEPVKGIDIFSRDEIGQTLKELKKNGVTVVMVTHDLEFAARIADRCSMIFKQAIIAESNGREFFTENMFYTTSISRMTRGLVDGCVLKEDVCFEVNQ